MAKTVLLTDVCEIQYGYPFDSKLFSDNKSDFPLIRIRDVVRGYTETYISEQCSEEYIVNQGDLLIGMDGEFNIAKWGNKPAYLNQRVCRLFPNPSIDKDFLLYCMPSILKTIEDKTAFVTVKHLSAKELNKISFELPELDEQIYIAEIFNKLTALISLRKKQLEKLDELVKSKFYARLCIDLHQNERMRIIP